MALYFECRINDFAHWVVRKHNITLPLPQATLWVFVNSQGGFIFNLYGIRSIHFEFPL